jgi:pyruvate formate lyase activating enzyme
MKNNNDKKGLIFDIQKFSIHDGTGIRTTVFFKGCPLRCLWCHNPEGLNLYPEIFHTLSKCIGCGACVKVCTKGGHPVTENGRITYVRDNCLWCGNCAAACPAGALETVGREMTVEEVIAEVKKDTPFYETSGGGMTVSGGEPMHQFPFLLELLRAAQREELHVCLETSGFAAVELFNKIVDLVDIFLFDLKETDKEKHREFTGVSLDPILKSLNFLNTRAKEIVLRCPIIPGFNDREEHLRSIGEMAESMERVSKVDVEPYHPLGISKSERLGTENPLNHLKKIPSKECVDQWVAQVAQYTEKPVLR